MAELWQLGCTGEFGCECPEKQKKARQYVHGTRRHYDHGCRCKRCVAANTSYFRDYRRKVRARGTS